MCTHDDTRTPDSDRSQHTHARTHTHTRCCHYRRRSTTVIRSECGRCSARPAILSTNSSSRARAASSVFSWTMPEAYTPILDPKS